jgi:hypothetical protein
MDFQTRMQEALREAANKARAFDKTSRKLAETLGDRAQAGLKDLLDLAQAGSREQAHAVGVELEKLGKKLQAAATEAKAKAAEAVKKVADAVQDSGQPQG